MLLKDKKAVVTGGASGIGQAICIALAKRGADLVVADLQDGSATLKEVHDLGRHATGIKVDVTKRDDVEAMVQNTLKEFGRIDILVNNAGIAVFKPFFDTTEADWNRQMDINAKGVFLVSQAVAKVMRAQGGGKIVNISSISAERAGANISAYCATKGAVSALTLCMALELAKYGIAVNAVLPGTTETPLNRAWHEIHPAGKQANIDGTPMGRLGKPEDIAHAVVFLASDESTWTTGALLKVDGGYCAK
jgi:NAD(P)-dependent dehydrogenase (short-subunit alcohol dehydrogenase family)